MDIITKGIVLNTKDYKEADKLATIFSCDAGKIVAKVVGVKKPKAKLKAVVQAFAEAEYEIMHTGEFYKIKTAKLLSSHAGVVQNYDALSVGYIVLETVDKVLPYHEAEPQIYELLQSTLCALESHVNVKAILIDFWTLFCKLLGTPAFADDVDEQSKGCYLDTSAGILSHFRTEGCAEVDNAVVHTLFGKGEKYDMAINLLYRILRIKYNISLTSMSLFGIS